MFFTKTTFVDAIMNARSLYRFWGYDMSQRLVRVSIMSKNDNIVDIVPGNVIRIHRADYIDSENRYMKRYMYGKRYTMDDHIACDLDIKGSIVIFKDKQVVFYDKKKYTWENQDIHNLNLISSINY